MILIITSKRDGHIQAVSKHLDEQGAPWLRLNIEDFATNIDVEVSPNRGTGQLVLKDCGRQINLCEVTAVWYRKPDPVILEHFEMDAPSLEYVEAEFTEIVHGLYALLDHAFWINNPFSTRLAHRKLKQLVVAANVGFAIPRTILTNQSTTALKFAADAHGEVAIKSLGAISVMQGSGVDAVQYGVFTRRVTLPELVEVKGKIAHMPTLFQEFLKKDSELRVTCIGDKIFPCRIQTRSTDITHDDYRFDTLNLEHTAIDCPELVDKLHAYMREMKINFGCFDFVLSPDKKLTFLECNCNGQWLWVEERTGQQIGKAIAQALIACAA